MAATHVVSLFLPYTLDFHDGPTDSKAASPPPLTPIIEKRESGSFELPTRLSGINLSELTANSASEEFFGAPTPDHQKRLSAKIGDPRSLVHSDAEVAAWGTDRVFNQPRSRAAPLPSGSILDFAKTHEELKQQQLNDAQRKARSPTQVKSPTLSRSGSSEHEYGSNGWSVAAPVHGNGGLFNAVRAAGGMEVTWIGTLGFPTDALPHSTREQIDDHLLNKYQSEVVYVSDKNLTGHYTHYCKTILWPIFHYQVPDHPKSKAYADHSWEFYRSVNQAFADKVVASYKRGDTIWIHDYHLLLVPGMVRKKLPDAQIGFFLHTAFPSSEIFRCLANRKDLLDGMLGASLIAFQTDEYLQHFLQTCSRLLTVETTAEGVQLEDRFVNVTSQPIGIDPAAIQEAREADEIQDWIKNIQKKNKGKKLIVARDKLDNVHGVRQKLLGFERFLNKYPEWVGKVVLIQVATSTSEQSELLFTVGEIAARIDRHSNVANQSLMFLKQDIDFAQYLALLTVADCLMVSSLRDGMGLTPHEYVFCQDGMSVGKKHGPLILSEFAGSSTVLHGQILINPWDYQGMADAIKQALEMDEIEREQRWSSLHAIVSQQTGGRWAEELSKTLSKVHEEQQNRRDATSIPRLSAVHISEKYETATCRLFLIDYEGTLTPHKTGVGMSLAQPHRILDALNDLMADPKNTVYIMSSRQPEELDSTFRTAIGVGLIAENGCFLREYGTGSGPWRSFVDLPEAERWKKDVKAILKYYQERMGMSSVEERRSSIIFHYGDVENQEAAVRQAGECADQINTACKAMGIQAVPITKAVLVEQTKFNKTTAFQHIFESMCQNVDTSDGAGGTPDFLVVAGNDREDEAVFSFANGMGKQGVIPTVFTVSVGKRNTEAQATLQGSTGLLTVLEKLAKISLDQMPVEYFNSPSKL